MSYLKIVRQISSLVTPDRPLARTSASVEKEKVSTSYVHNSGSDKRHAASTKPRACWKAPVHGGSRARERSGTGRLQLASMLWPRAGPWLGQEVLPGVWPRPGSRELGQLGCGSRNAFCDLEDRKTAPASPPHSELFWLS